MRALARRLLAALLVFLFVPADAAPPSAADAATGHAAESAIASFERLERAAARGAAPDVAADLRRFSADARGLIDPLAGEIAEAEKEFAALGPAPKEGEPPEAAALAAERAGVAARLADLRSKRTRLAAAIEQADALLARLTRAQLETLYQSLAVQEAPLAAPALWTAAARDVRALADAAGRYAAAWRRDVGNATLSYALVAAAALVAFLFFGPASAAMRRALADPLERQDATRERRIAVAGVKVLARLLTGVAGGFVIIESARATGLLGGEGLHVARALWAALLGWLVARGFLTGLFNAPSPAWRLSGVGAERARAVSILTLAIVVVFGLKLVLVAAASAAGVGDALVEAARGLSATIVGGLIVALSRRGLWIADGAAAPANRWTFVRRTARVFGVALVAAAFAGYARLADFAASRVYYGALILGIAWALRAALKEAAVRLDRRLRKAKDEDDGAGRRAALYWFGFAIDAALLLLLAPALLLLAGMSGENVRDATARAFTGLRIGGATISIGDVVAALLAFAGVLTLTRVVQGALQRGPLAYSRMDRGVQDSLVTLTGYAGLVVAAVVGISILGVNLSNLALIAGALSVGIGLGLQGVVNNFVSGLILLFERPIKVGDWIVTGAGQGIVRKISVRSTEIETFEKSSIIVPNSDLITQPVTNITHRGTTARQLVTVAVGLDADARRVYDILLNCAREHRLVLVDPGPFVNWKTIGPTSLEFELGVFIADVGKGLEVRNDLRFAILKALRAERIPFPQPDLYRTIAPDTGAGR